MRRGILRGRLRPDLIIFHLSALCCAAVLFAGGSEPSVRAAEPGGAINNKAIDDNVTDNTEVKNPLVAAAPPTTAEARQRARILHETLHGVLQVMHRDFFREDEGLSIPSHSLEDVFTEVAKAHKVKIGWLAVDADALNVDHRPDTDFERAAVKALASGKSEYDATQGNEFMYAGEIRLSSQCLKCHAPRRTSTDDRKAGLLISMPIQQP